MLADTSAIHALASADAAQAAELAAVAAQLSAVPGPAAAAVLGPVAGSFLASLADAAAGVSCAVAELSHSMTAAAGTAHACADSYAEAEHRAAGRFTGFEA